MIFANHDVRHSPSLEVSPDDERHSLLASPANTKCRVVNVICNTAAVGGGARQTLLLPRQASFLQIISMTARRSAHSTVTLFARFRGLSTSVPRAHAV